MTILVVENDRSLRELLHVHLTNAGYEVLLAQDAVAAGPLLLGPSEIDLAIVDAQLPYLSGVELVATLIADTTLPAIAAILIAGHEQLAAGAEHLGVPCLVKPFTVDELLHVVRDTIRPAIAEASASLRPIGPRKLVGNAR